jgi:hypothetical protein
MRLLNILFSLLLLMPGIVLAQNNSTTDNNLIQFSGVVVTSDSLDPVAFATIYEKKTRMGTVSDYFGYFSFVAEKGDTILFSCVGFKTSAFVIPDSLKDYRVSIIQLMTRDTITLKPFVRYPWPSKDEFAQAFVDLDVSDFGYSAATNNLRDQEMILRMNNVGNDAYLAYKWDMYQQQQRLYYAGQAPPINLFNPVAWAQFIKAWKSGAFKSGN